MPPSTDVDRYATRVLGPVTHTEELTRRVGRIVAVTDDEGREWVLKTAPTRLSFAREVRAYRHWAPHFADQAPALRHANRRLRTLVLERVPGHSQWSFAPSVHEAAGRLLRRIHESAPARSGGPGVGEVAAQKLASTARTLPSPDLVGVDERGFVRAGVRALHDDFAHLPRVPCHGDYGGHNWITGAGELQVIDFSLARFNAAASDFARLFIGPWWARPHLVDAFFDGYGRAISEEELACVRLMLPVLAVGLVGHGRRHGDTAMEHRGRRRLRALMDGADFTRHPSAWRRAWHATRRGERSLRTGLG